LRSVEKNLEASDRLLSASESASVRQHYERLRVALSGQDPQAIREACFQLGRATQGLADAILKDALNQARS